VIWRLVFAGSPIERLDLIGGQFGPALAHKNMNDLRDFHSK
jgi:hypothetical protein